MQEDLGWVAGFIAEIAIYDGALLADGHHLAVVLGKLHLNDAWGRIVAYPPGRRRSDQAAFTVRLFHSAAVHVES